MLSSAATTPPTPIFAWLVLAAALLISVVTDLASRRILDVVTYPCMALSLLARGFAHGLGDAEVGVLSGLLGAALGGGLLALLTLWRKGFGWGDVKLVAAVGAALGYPLVIVALVLTSLIGAVQAVGTLVWQAVTRAERRDTPGGPRFIPYGLAIALGSFWAMWRGER